MNKQEGDGWAALERVRTDVAKMQANHEKQADDAKASNMTPHSERYIRGCADAEGDVLDAIDRELAARPAKEPGLTIAETEKHMAALCDEDAEVEQWERDAICRPLDGPPSPPDFAIFPECIAEAVRIMRERGAAAKRAEKERDAYCDDYRREAARAVKAEAEVARLRAVAETDLAAIVAKFKEATK